MAHPSAPPRSPFPAGDGQGEPGWVPAGLPGSPWGSPAPGWSCRGAPVPRSGGAKHRQQLHPKHSWKRPAGRPAGSVSRPICTRAPRPFFYSRNGTSNKVTLTRKASRPSLPRGAGMGTRDVPAELPHSQGAWGCGREVRGSAWCAQSPLGSWGEPQGRTGQDGTATNILTSRDRSCCRPLHGVPPAPNLCRNAPAEREQNTRAAQTSV